ncbi:MAG TPA: hypothetical protein VMW24_16665 [Sedimentisphaerales bacterium]|nr:hypothetical protein [Sedimentisphaerales bacterium]
MPYKIEKRKGPRPYKIINTDRNEVVGSSETRAMAEMSIRHREGSENEEDNMRHYVRDRKKATGKGK